MRPFFYTLIILLVSCKSIFAQQYVTVPDLKFVEYLQAKYPGCMNGNQMDITCPEVVNDTLVDVTSRTIGNLSGIEHFTSLRSLKCASNNLETLPALPASLRILLCNNNRLISLPVLPDSLELLWVSSNRLTTLPDLPLALLKLDCQINQLDSLPDFPDGMNYLACGNNLYTHLPALPSSLEALFVSMNPLPDGLPDLPTSLKILYCEGNELSFLPVLPPSLEYLNCRGNRLETLPPLPNSLKELWCESNRLTQLPELPDSLDFLICRSNELTSLPALPSSVRQLACSFNNLTQLPQLPPNLFSLDCRYNQITCFSRFPETADWAGDNFEITENPFTCLPNYIEAMSLRVLTYPLCINGDTVGNPNSCPGAQGILGYIYQDANADCISDSAERRLTNIPLRLRDANGNQLSKVYSLANGTFFFSQSLGIYSISVDTSGSSFSLLCGLQDTLLTIDSLNPLLTGLNFAVGCKSSPDMEVRSMLTSGWIFPGQVHHLKILAGELSQWHNLTCISGVGGEFSLNITGPVTYVGVPTGALHPVVQGNTFVYTVSDWGNILDTDLELLFMTDTTAGGGDQICAHAHMGGFIDTDTTNNSLNFCYDVVNSYDPNEKEVYPKTVELGYDSWLTYTIHFQNTGTAPAFNIRLEDTLDEKLDRETFQVVNYSHPNSSNLKGNKLTFRFNGIMLSDSTSDLEGSKGYVQYRIKPISGFQEGTQITNTAYIYFDYNAPIVTNTVSTEYGREHMSVPENKNAKHFSVFPNPGSGLFWLNLPDKAPYSLVEIIDMTGKLYQKKVWTQTTQLDLTGLPKGVYTVRIHVGEETYVQRIILCD